MVDFIKLKISTLKDLIQKVKMSQEINSLQPTHLQLASGSHFLG